MQRSEFRKGYTIVDNVILYDRSLSAADRGIMVTLLSRPTNWDFSIAGLAQIMPNGKDAIRTSIERLERMGYLTRVKKRNNKGRYACDQWVLNPDPFGRVLDAPSAEKPSMVISQDSAVSGDENGEGCRDPLTEETATENPTQTNREADRKKEKINEDRLIGGGETYHHPININQSRNQFLASAKQARDTLDSQVESIREQIEYFLLKQQLKGKAPHEDKLGDIDVLVDALVFLKTCEEPLVISGCKYTLDDMRKQAELIDAKRAGKILAAFWRAPDPIRHPENYITAAILRER